MATQDRHAQFGETALRLLGLPSANSLPGLTPEQVDAYWRLAQAMRFLKEGKPIYGSVASTLPSVAETLRTLWPGLPPGTPDALTVSIWVARLQEATATLILAARPPAASQMLQYLYQVALLTDVASLDTLPDSDVVPLRLDPLWEQPPAAQVLPVPQAVLMFCAVQNARRRCLLRITLEADADTGYFRLAAPPDLGISREAFFTPTGEPRGDFSAEAIGDILLGPLSDEALVHWPAFMRALEERCQSVLGGGLLELPLRLFGNYAGNLRAYLVDADKLSSMGLAKILGPLVRGETHAPFLNAVLEGNAERRSVSLRSARRDLFLGHMDERAGEGRSGFPLDPTQRLAAMSALSMNDLGLNPPILPVNGPPGTGKTSFLRAVLASTWVRAAYEQAKQPPLVVGTGATNKAVSNIIDAFGSVAGLSGSDLSSRWLDGLPSYGWLFPSKDARKLFPSLMHLVFDEASRTAYTPDGGAIDLRLTSLDSHRATYTERAIKALGLSARRSWEITDIVAELHGRIVSSVDRLRAEQQGFAAQLAALKSRWLPARGLGKQVESVQDRVATLQGERQRLDKRSSGCAEALRAVRQCLDLQAPLETGWVRRIRDFLGDGFFKQRLADVGPRSEAAWQALEALDITWPAGYADRQQVYASLARELADADRLLAACEQQLAAATAHQRSLTQTRQASREAIRAVLAALHEPGRLPPGEHRNVVYALRFARATDEDASADAEDMLWQRFDANQDRQRRFDLFHLAARYWEGRWLIRQAENEDKRPSNEERLRQLMMLGVIIVSTTHKLPAIGKDATIDLLVVDESGQCAPEVGAAMLSFARSALLVGDTKQLQPVPGLTEMQSTHLAKTLDLTLPPAFCAARGSAMALARFVTPLTDGVDGTGITLLYHYRCHPTIIGYCNELLYGGQIRYVRPDQPTPATLPPMSWVEVAGQPIKQGSSSINEAELQEIARWIREIHPKLTAAYGKPLDEVLAVITPMRAQAIKARTYLTKALADDVPKDVLERMTIGTVHALQGAERPVVAFSLVQQRRQGALFADRDGGFLMNVAVSRAKDAFVVFAERNTLRAGPSDAPNPPAEERLPVGQLGAYLRRHGHRLYPRRLVVVEAKNKVPRIRQILGTNCAVIASNGYLGSVSIQDDDSLAWSAPPAAFVAEMKQHAGLVDDLLVATDDDLAGELIGLQVAEVAADTLGNLPVRRMRFHSLEPDHVRDALAVAGPRFDADMLAAALLREAMGGLDRRRFQERFPQHPYIAEPERALVALVDELDQDTSMSVEVLLEAEGGERFPAYVPENEAILAWPASMTDTQAQELAAKLVNQPAIPIDRAALDRVPPLYPSSTTQRILAAAADGLGMLPWDTQDHLNAMYQSGAQDEQ